MNDSQGQVPRERRRRPPARTPATRCRPPARRSPAGRRATAYNRGQVLYRVAEMLEGRRAQFVDEVQRSARASRKRQAEAVVDAADRPAGLVRRLGRQDRPGRRRRQPGRRRRTSTSRCPSRPASSPSLAPQELVAARPGQRGRAGDRHRQHRAWSLASEQRPLPAITLAEVLATSDVPGGVVNVLTGALGRDRARGWPRTWTSTRIDLTGLPATPTLATRPGGRRRREPQAGAARPAPSRTGPPSPGLDRMTRVPGDQDGLAPDRHLSA